MNRQPHPVDEAGLPYIPERYFDFDADEVNKHHMYFYRRWYVGVSAVHHAFRELHIVEMPVEGHKLFHKEIDPPEVPSYDFMAGFLIASEIPMSRRLKDELRGWRHGKRSYR